MESSNLKWVEAQKWEKNWWMTYTNFHQEEIKKNDFVSKMMFLHDGAPESSVLDIGCGPFSLLQRYPVKKGVALDPIHYGEYEEEYKKKNILRLIKKGEDISIEDGDFDEVWIYNCLQHVENPTKILENAIKISKKVRIFEWTFIKPHVGHLHELTPDLLTNPFNLANWNKMMTTTGYLNHSGLVGTYFMGIFTKNKETTL